MGSCQSKDEILEKRVMFYNKRIKKLEIMIQHIDNDISRIYDMLINNARQHPELYNNNIH